MITANMYKNYLNTNGNNLGQVRKTQSDNNINATFKTSPEYKRIYILTKDGWIWEDAKFFRHVKQSISGDTADSYLQFRPKIHYPIGSYVIIPDDTDFNINLNTYELLNPFSQPVDNRTQWWILVNRNDTNYPLYNILKCNWNFKWIHNGEIQECFGCMRDASSYTSGIWGSEFSWSLNDLTSAWLPDIHYVYGDKLHNLGLYDNRSITHEQRFIITTNTIHPDVYMVSDTESVMPKGIIKIKLKSDDYNATRDNIDLMIADYYNDAGHPYIIPVDNPEDFEKTSQIYAMNISPMGILEVDHTTNIENPEIITIGKGSYFNVVFSDDKVVDPIWKIELISDISNLSKDKTYYENLIKLTEFDDSTCFVKPSKASSLKGLQFKLSVSDINKEYESYTILEVDIND